MQLTFTKVISLSHTILFFTKKVFVVGKIILGSSQERTQLETLLLKKVTKMATDINFIISVDVQYQYFWPISPISDSRSDYRCITNKQQSIQCTLSRALADQIAANRRKMASIVNTVVFCGRQM